MALKSTIYKADLEIADIDRGYYAEHALTLARHPSETEERLMLRVLAFAMNANEDLAFGRGLSTDDEPDLWRKDLTGTIEQWIELGLPDERRLRKACGRARQVVVYGYGGRAVNVWWGQNRDKLARLENLRVFAVPADASQALAKLARRTMQLQVMIQEGQAWMSDGEERIEVGMEALTD